jgi:hypothetical protein
MTKPVFLLLVCAVVALPQDVVFRGVPSVRVSSSAERDDRDKLDSTAAQKAECVIGQQGKNKYVWLSRNRVPLTRVDSPTFTYFVHPGGLGYVKVFTGQRSEDTSSVEYIESYTEGFQVVTYWGRVQNPEQ